MEYRVAEVGLAGVDIVKYESVDESLNELLLYKENAYIIPSYTALGGIRKTLKNS